VITATIDPLRSPLRTKARGSLADYNNLSVFSQARFYGRMAYIRHLASMANWAERCIQPCPPATKEPARVITCLPHRHQVKPLTTEAQRHREKFKVKTTSGEAQTFRFGCSPMEFSQCLCASVVQNCLIFTPMESSPASPTQAPSSPAGLRWLLLNLSPICATRPARSNKVYRASGNSL
jgi:hypothetical protein